MLWTDEPHADFQRYEREQARRFRRLPRCTLCGEAIQGQWLYVIGGERLCEDCMNEEYREWAEDHRL